MRQQSWLWVTVLKRIFQGLLGLFLAFSAGSKLQPWLGEGKVWHRSKERSPILLSADEMPISYTVEVALYVLYVLGDLLWRSVVISNPSAWASTP